MLRPWPHDRDERPRRLHPRLLAVPHAPEIQLHVADEATQLRERTEEELGQPGPPPPFWAFAWAGGQALARYLLNHPKTVAGRRVLDFASGSASSPLPRRGRAQPRWRPAISTLSRSKPSPSTLP